MTRRYLIVALPSLKERPHAKEASPRLAALHCCTITEPLGAPLKRSPGLFVLPCRRQQDGHLSVPTSKRPVLTGCTRLPVLRSRHDRIGSTQAAAYRGTPAGRLCPRSTAWLCGLCGRGREGSAHPHIKGMRIEHRLDPRELVGGKDGKSPAGTRGRSWFRAVAARSKRFVALVAGKDTRACHDRDGHTQTKGARSRRGSGVGSALGPREPSMETAAPHPPADSMPARKSSAACAKLPSPCSRVPSV